MIWKNPLIVDYDKYTLANEFLVATKGDANVDVQTESTNAVFILYTNTGDHPNGLLDLNALKIMKKMEDNIQLDEGYKKFCLAKKPQNEGDPVVCDESKFNSALSTIIGDKDLETTTQEKINEDFLATVNSPQFAFLSFLYDKELSADNLKIRYMRSLYSNGGPL